LLDGVKLGDVDGDGDITITDATAVQRYLAELDVLDDIHLYAADANGDGDVDISDATAIQMAVAKIPTGYPIGEVITK
ncbi:MAG: dockerin type I repeat-containing protein, partial [Eubacteriales bacterium]|nr:dockerin type I repeat-containing protein [Eubacteriales bacterium]